ncbi:helix-turn-helix transcriptional regulator [Parapedobacter sp. SGR-10]|uniref:helix-turn-helix domain-containing protein n=1 Tax=Parapedobacter sp. SGR-10 TaxID=2710879 RepID=UPI0013D49AB6|nr:helix-turn-helix transcriptional regulator [Parapedobacter sp. SGR-10]NGF57448.1 helix-turn-helix transcriptional regulator [Parapedobacter sp. SGR-10]
MAVKNPRNEELIKQFGKNVRKYRRKKGLTIAQLAHECGIKYGAVSTIERGIVNCTISTAHAIAQALDVSLDVLIKKETPNLSYLNPNRIGNTG